MKLYKLAKRLLKLSGVLVLSFSLVLPGIVNASDKFNMTYIYFGNDNLYVSHVDQTKSSLDEISPNYFNVTVEGTLEITTAAKREFVKEMHSRGIRVVPFISNHWNLEAGRNALKNREELSRQIADAVVEYDLDGVNVDIEGLNHDDRENYNDFLRLLRKDLPSGRTIATAVAANPWHINTGWQGSYDYETLAKYSDYLMIMAYDQHYGGSAPGPIASSEFVEDSIKYALSKVPKDKIVLGIPFYGRYWKHGSSYGGYGISLTHVEGLVQKYSGKIEYDRESQSPKAVITIKQGDEKPSLFGRKLDAGTYTIWYENETSIKSKLRLVQKYDIKGTGSWSLGQEPPNTWNYYKLWLNGYYFVDIQGHWAQEEIFLAEKEGWMKGVSSTSFLPDSPLTRAEAATVLVRMLGLEDSEVEYTFKDTDTHWARKEIEIAREHNIVKGIGNNRFAPDTAVTRQEMAVMLDRVFADEDTKTDKENPYVDIEQESCAWSYESIVRMTGFGLFKGNLSNEFRPQSYTSRAEMATLINRIAVVYK